MSVLLLLLAQAGPLDRGPVTVGDSVWIERALGDVGNAIVRPQPWSLGSLGQQLGPAVVIQGSRGFVVRYPLVLWYPGSQVLTMPGPVLVRRDGSSDTLAATSYRLEVSSVLPAGQKRSTLAPKPARDTVPLVSRNLLPLALLDGIVLLSMGIVALRWRRRGAPEPPAPPVEVFPPSELLRRWAAAGEYRAALDGWSWRLTRRMLRSTSLEETAALQRVLDDIADTVFMPNAAPYLAGLCERAAGLEPA
jgi:hypothetical protein